MNTIIKIVIAVALMNGAARVAMAEASYYQLKDRSQELVTFGGQMSVAELQDQILTKAQELDVPLAPEALLVRREALHTMATASYTLPVEVFPNYLYPINFSFSVEALSMTGLTAPPSKR